LVLQAFKGTNVKRARPFGSYTGFTPKNRRAQRSAAERPSALITLIGCSFHSEKGERDKGEQVKILFTGGGRMEQLMKRATWINSLARLDINPRKDDLQGCGWEQGGTTKGWTK